MKKTIYGILLIVLVVISACGNFTDIEPKGMNLLNRVTDLDQLLNYRYLNGVFGVGDCSILINDAYPTLNIPNEISRPVKTLRTALLTWDERINRAELSTSDTKYELYYRIIGRVANPVLLQVDDAEGDRVLAMQLKAEAYVLRAWFHYLAVNVFAKAYNPTTTATDPGIPYVKEHDLLSVPSKKYTVQEVYDFILADLRAALELNSLPNEATNLMRVSLPFAYAVEAQVRMSMHDFSGAWQAAEKSLAIKNTIDDHRPFVGETFARPELQSTEDLFFAGQAYIMMIAPTPELSAVFEPGSIFNNTISKMNERGPAMFGLTTDVIYSLTTYLCGSGLTTVDMNLVCAECKLRSGDISGTMEIINHIREYRIDPAMYAPLTAANATEAFAALKKSWRTENWCGPKNFINLKRWNTEAAYKETLRKTLLGVNYELPPDSPLWIFPFPQNAIAYNPNLTQNYE
ncbi:MAG: RagB/SusD family nutrient uptake outer membrane protein [Dysgonamonadaceae bacterium]|jgi:hypothetical protein|nr:RagB/SusD family nutrient uptake outer membrane protein [Dysgonamonadaceae bacterium]